VTATVEIVSSQTLNNDEIALFVEYMGTAGSSQASFADSFVASILTPPTPVPTSGATWNALPATPVAQHLQVSFTPRQPGRVRGQVRLGRAGTTVYVNPVMVIA
jgi:hypothetical protein